jgi:hypothetical protein
MEDGYFGSGQMLWHSINKYGKESHVKSILEIHDTRSEIISRERVLVDEKRLRDPLCMNLRKGGGASVEEMSTPAKQRISEAAKKRDPSTRIHSPETKAKISKSNQKPKHPEAVRKSVAARLAVMTPEFREKLAVNRGKHWYNDGVKSFLMLDTDAIGLRRGRITA